jgi:hypothetical protein
MIDFLLGVPGKLKAISDYLTTNWTAAKAVFLDAAISTRAPASGALSDAVWTGTKAGYVDAAISSRGTAIKLIQRGKIVIGALSSSNTATITAVVMGKTEMRLLGNGFRYDGTNGFTGGYIELTNTTTVTASRFYSDVTPMTVSWELTEFN